MIAQCIKTYDRFVIDHRYNYVIEAKDNIVLYVVTTVLSENLAIAYRFTEPGFNKHFIDLDSKRNESIDNLIKDS